MSDWKLFAIGSAFFAGLTAILAKIGVKNIPTNLATLIRTVVILGFITFIVSVRREWKGPLDRTGLIFLVLSGLATGLSWLCYFRALQSGPASLVAPIDKLSLVFAVGLSLLFLGERLSVYQWVGIGFITLGTFIVILK